VADKVPTRVPELERLWNAEGANLENVLLPYDFFRRELDYDPQRPLVLTKDAGLLAVFGMDGVDPEPLGEERLAAISGGMRRALDAFNGGSLEGQWSEGAWEIQNIFTRGEGRAPMIASPKRDSAALRLLTAGSNAHWQARLVFVDELLWAIKFVPRNRDRRSHFRLLVSEIWDLFKGTTHPLAQLSALRAQARFVRRVLELFQDSVHSVVTQRPRMHLGLRWLSEEETYAAIWRQVNRRRDEPPVLRRDLPLLNQVAGSYRDNSGAHYEIDGRPTRVLTWKMPPEVSVAYLFSGLQSDLRFPFTVVQNFTSVDFRRMSQGILGLSLREKMAAAMARHRDSAEFAREAAALTDAVFSEKACVFYWYFAVIVSGSDVHELESRVTKISTYMKRLRGSEVLEERENRVLGELAALPGNSRYGLRYNVVTSRNGGDLAMVYRLSSGDREPILLFGDRQGGVYSYSLFSRGEPSWSKAVLGPPGSGKSVMLQSFLLGNATQPSQGYVIDRGNSFGPLFELLSRESPSDVAVMRFQGGSFQFNPLPLVWALEEKARRIAAGTYQLALEDGSRISCPVAEAKIFFEAWLEGLLGQGEMLAMERKNRLDRALKGASGKGGFFKDYEIQCRRYLEERRQGNDGPPPRPLWNLLTHLRSDAPEFVPAVELWTRAPRHRFFDSGHDTVQTAKYVYFELTGLESDPLVAVPFVMALMGTVWRRIQDPSVIHERKAVIIDEAWSFLAHPAFLRVVDEMFRTIRKFNGFVTLATQSSLDVQQGNARKLLQTMSEVFLYRGFSVSDEFLSEDLELAPHQIEQIRGLREDDQRREVFYVSRRGMNRILSVEIPPALYWFVTTDSQDKHWRNVFCGRLGLSDGVIHLVKACDGRTIVNGNDRIERVRRYARELGLPEKEDSGCS
jgi:hypothetical protein